MTETRDWRRAGRGIAAIFLLVIGGFGLLRGLGAHETITREFTTADPKDSLVAPGVYELRGAARVSFIDLDENDRRLTRLGFVARPLESGSALEITFRAGDRGGYLVVLRFADRFDAELIHAKGPGDSERIATGSVARVGDSIALSLRLDDQRIALFSGDTAIVSAVHDGPRNGRLSMRASAGSVAIDGCAATGIDSAGAPYSFAGPDVPASSSTPAWERTLLALSAIVLLAFLLLRPENRARRLIVAALALVLSCFAIDRATRRELAEVDRDRFALAAATSTREEFRLDDPRTLDASNSLVIPGPVSNARLNLRATFSADAVLEVRMRSSPTRAAGIAWIGSTRKSLGCGFVRQETNRSTAIGSRGEAAATDREIEVEIESNGARYLARVDGNEVSRAEDGRFAAGSIVLNAAAGRVTIRSVVVEPGDLADVPRSARNGLASAIGSLLAATALLFVLARHRFEDALGLAAIALLPCAALHVAPVMQKDLFTVAFASFVALVIGSQIRARAVGIVRAQLALVSSLVLAPCGVLAIALESPLAVEAQEMGSARVERDLVHFQHPAVRQLNDYLAHHRFRGREHSLVRPAGTSRVLCLGTSSTWGFGFEDGSGLDYPSILERRLAAAGRNVETLNAAYPGTHAHCLERVLENQLRDFEFDVVTISLTYNDSYATTQSDGHTNLERAIGLHPWLRTIDSARIRSTVLPARVEMQRLIAAFDSGERSTVDVWRSLGHLEDPPLPVARFEASLRRMAATATKRGARVVFMKEPLRGDRRMIWKDEFRAAIDRVAADFGGFVADPTPALLAFRGPRLFQDDVHPTAEGNEIIAEVLEGVVARALDSR